MGGIRRGLISLVALLALGTSQAHAGWSVCCSGGEEQPAEHAHAGEMAAQTSSTTTPHHDTAPGSPECETGVLRGCVVVATIPLATTLAPAMSPILSAPTPTAAVMPRLLLERELFRPPIVWPFHP